MTLVDPAAIRAGLERQLELIAPVADHLNAAAAEATSLLPAEWTGPAADAAGGFAAELRALLHGAAEAADDAARRLRLEIAGLM